MKRALQVVRLTLGALRSVRDAARKRHIHFRAGRRPTICW